MFKPTDEQKLAINNDGSILVSAAAGSGKTAVLVERIIRKICSDKNPASLERMLVVTYTNAAAAEMRERIEKRLLEEQKKNPKNNNIRKQLMLLPSAFISTIDSFCIYFVRENFEKFSLSPDFKTVPTEDIMGLYSDALDSVLDVWYESHPKEIKELLEALGSVFGDSVLRDAVTELFNYSRNMPFPDRWLLSCAEKYADFTEADFDSWRKECISPEIEYLKLVKTRLSNALKNLPENASEEHKCQLANAISYADKILSQSSYDEILQTVTQAKINTFSRNRDEISKTLRPALEDAVSALSRLNNAIGNAKDVEKEQFLLTVPPTVSLINLTLDFSSVLYALMRENNTFTFFNTEQMVFEALCTEENGEYMPTEQAKELSARFDEILVDEYQDTNDLQNMLFYLLSDNGRKLFTVGDAKQSIYGFRGSNPENFIQNREKIEKGTFAEGAGNIYLSSNFRSRKGICNFVNYFFSLIMSKEFGGIDYNENEKLNPKADYPESDEPCVEIHFTSVVNEDNAAEAEAEHIAGYIKKAMSDGIKVYEDGAYRPARYSDFAVLLRSHTKVAPIYLEKMQKAGIPTSFGTGGFLEAPEISAMLSILRVIDNPTYDISLLTLMLSPIYGFTADDVANIRMYKRKSSLYGALIAAENAGFAPANRLLSDMRRFRSKAATLSIPKLVGYIYRDMGIIDVFSALDGGEKRRNNLLLLEECAEKFEGETLTAFVKYVEKTCEKKETPAGSAENAVKLMSMHKSKGLQFPICIIAGAFNLFNLEDTKKRYIMDKEFGVAIKCDNKELHKKIEPINFRLAKRRTVRKQVEEDMRLLYVGFTRAKEKLVIVMCDKNPLEKAMKIAKEITPESCRAVVNSANKYAQWILYAVLRFGGNETIREPYGIKIPESLLVKNTGCKIATYIDASAESKLEEEPEIAPKTVLDVKDIRERFLFNYPYDALKTAVSKTSVSAVIHSKGEGQFDFKDRPAFVSAKGLTPAERGTATHTFMQFADYSSAVCSVEDEIARLHKEGYITKTQADAIDRRALKSFFEGRLCKCISDADEVYRELRFMTEMAVDELYGIENPADEKTVVQGVMDCITEKDGELTVIDFKTDRVNDADVLKDMYARQLEIYAAAAEKMFNKPVTHRYLYSFALNTDIEC